MQDAEKYYQSLGYIAAGKDPVHWIKPGVTFDFVVLIKHTENEA